MYKKVIVLELKNAYALVMEEGGRVIRICLKEGLAAGDTIYVLPEDIYQEERAFHTVLFPAGGRKREKKSDWIRFCGMVAILALCIALLPPQFSPTVYAVASFDGEASVQVELDEQGCILSAGSPDGSVQQEMLDGLKGKTIEGAAAELSAWCGGGSLLVGYALTHGGEGDLSALRCIQALFPKQPVVALSGVAGDIHAADGQSVSLGRYLMSQLDSGDVDEILEELPPEIIGRLLQEPSSWNSHPELLEALEERWEEYAEEGEDGSGSSEKTEDDPDGPEEEDAAEEKEQTDQDEDEEQPGEDLPAGAGTAGTSGPGAPEDAGDGTEDESEDEDASA